MSRAKGRDARNAGGWDDGLAVPNTGRLVRRLEGVGEPFHHAYQNVITLPPGSTNDAIGEFHAELLQWDAFVADLAVPHARGGEVVRPVYDFGGAITNVRSRMRWHRQVHPADAEIVDRYLHYLDLVADTYSALRDARGWSEPG